MVESLWLWFGGRRGCHGSCGFGGRVGGGEEVDLLRYGAAKVIEGFAKVGWVVIGFVGVLGASLRSMDSLSNPYKSVLRDLKHLLVYLLEGVDALLKFNIVGWKLSLWYHCQRLWPLAV